MRILHLCQPTDGGTAVVVRDLARAGVAAGDHVTVGSPSGGYLPDWVSSAGAAWVNVPMSRSPSWRDLQVAWRIRRLYRAADVVHLHSSKAGAVGRLAASSQGSSRPRIFFTPHGWSWYVSARNAWLYRLFERWAARVTDVIIVVSSEELAAGRAVLGAGRRIELIENGVDAEVFTPDGPTAERGAAPLVVQVGRLSTQKGQDRSIHALGRCADPTVRLRLVGEGPAAAALRDLAANLGVAERVEFVGSVDPRPHLRAADVVVLPSRWEGMSLVLLEAMAVGAAVVATDCGGSGDVLRAAGRVLARGDDERVVTDLQAAVRGLLASDVECRELGRRARATVRQRFLLHDTVARYLSLWHEC